MIKEENGIYIYLETVNGGYLQRGQYAMYRIESKWDKDLNFITLSVDSHEWESLLDVNNYHHNRAIKAKARHLRLLKEELGLIQPKEPKYKLEKTILIEKSDYYRNEEIKIKNITVKDKTIDGIGKFNYHFIKFTEDKMKLVEEYNEKIKEFKEYKNNMIKKIFEY